MKKILLPILALGGLLFASSCQMDEPDAGTLTGEVDFTITAGIPSGITTYSPTDGNAFSHLGGINNVSGDYVLRFILEVYDGDAVAYEETQYLEDFSNPNVTFNPRLLAKKYDFVFWADFVAKEDSEEARGDLYYNTSNGLTSISYNNVTETVLTTDLVDAYTAHQQIDLSESSQNVNVTLTRPFGKIRLLATDNPQNQVDDNLKVPTSATIAFTDAKVPATFNALTGEASDEPTLSVTGYTFTAVKETSPVVTGHNDLAFAYLLGQTYFFESPSSTAYKMTVTVKNENEQIGYRELTNIPVSANKLTTVIGNFYTNEGNIDVIVEDKFGEGEEVKDVPETYTVADGNALQAKLNELAGQSPAPKSVILTVEQKLEVYNTMLDIPEGLKNTDITLVLKEGLSDVNINWFTSIDYAATLTLRSEELVKNSGMSVYLTSGTTVFEGTWYNAGAYNNVVVDEDATINYNLTVGAKIARIYGTVNNDVTVDGDGATVYWGAGTEDRLREVLAYPAEKNHGVILTADIQSTKLDVNNGSQENQDGFKVGGSSINGTNNFVENPYDGYVFDGNGFSLSGAAYNNVLAIYANDVVVKNLEVYQDAAPAKANAGISVYRVQGVKLENVEVHDCGKAGVIVNASEVRAAGLHTYANAWGGVNVSKGGAPSGGPKPVFAFDSESSFEEITKVYVDLDRTGTDYQVTVPSSDWVSYTLNNKQYYTNEFMFSGSGTDADPYVVADKEGLQTLSTLVNAGNDFKGKTFVLSSDIDLNNETWTPIGMSGKAFQGNFDGNGHKISNLKAGTNSQNDVGLFGFTTNGTIKNIHIHNAQIKGYQHVGVVAGTPYTTKYSNIKVTGLIKVDGYAYVGGMFGKNVYANLTDLRIDADEGSYVKAESENYRTYVGGVVGFMGEGGHSVSNVVSNIDVYGSTCDVGGITGIAHYNNKFINCICTGNVTLENAQDSGDQLEIGGIAGVWHNEDGTTVTFTDCSFTGTLTTSLKGVDYSDEIADTNKITGRAYNTTGTGQLIIDGVVVSDGSAQ